MGKDQVEHIKANVDIVTVISEHVHLKKRGRTFWGLCPFHNEKTPSFQVDPDRQIYKCFGCDKGGDVITFLMEKKALSFPEALRELSERTGIPIEVKKGKASSERKIYYDANRAAMEYYERMFFSDEGQSARAYLSSRGVSDDTVRAFHIGWAPDAWSGLCSHLNKTGVSLQAACTCGLVLQRKAGGFYDRFRNRVMFPIHDLSGEVIGFGGRILGPGEPKYINTPESPIFEKRKVLYNLMRARGHIREDAVVIVEGYMDVVSLENAGFHRSVATLGTALSEDHVHLLRRFTENMILIFDGDSAGKNAMIRSLEPFMASDVVPRIVLLPPDTDPDDIARSDMRQWYELLSGSQSLWDLLFDESFSTRDPSKLDDQNTIIRELAPVISRVHDETIRNLLAQRMSVRLGIQPDVIFPLIRKDAHGASISRGDGHTGKRAEEETLVRLLLLDEDAVHVVRSLDLQVDFHDTSMRTLFDYIIEKGPGILTQDDCPDTIRVLASRVMALGEFPGDAKKALIDILCRFKSLSIDAQLHRIQADILRSEQSGEMNRIKALLKEKQEKIREKRSLRTTLMEVLQKR
ncbi:MAG: DNA primase [Desulfomonilia bacterium]